MKSNRYYCYHYLQFKTDVTFHFNLSKVHPKQYKKEICFLIKKISFLIKNSSTNLRNFLYGNYDKKR